MAVKHVLLVEDNIVFAEVLQELLKRTGITTQTASTVAEAERIFAVVPVDAVLLDGTLGGARLNVIPFLRRMRRDGFGGPVIAISGQAADNAVLCEHGASFGIVKIHCQRIVAAVKTLSL